MDKDLKTKTIVTVLVLGIIITVIVVILSLIYIWTPKTKEEAQKLELGEYMPAGIGETQVVEKYINEIGFLIKNKAFNKLFQKVNKGYIDKFTMTENNFEQFIRNKGLVGKKLKVVNFKKQKINSKTYYKVNVKTNDYKIGTTIIIIEDSPNIYTISFDDFLYERELNREYINDGFKMTVLNEVVRAEKIDLRIKLENLTNKNIILNSSKNENPIRAIKLGDEINIKLDELSGKSIEMPVNSSKEYTLTVPIEDFKHSTLRAIEIKSVNRNNGSNVNNVQFPYHLEK